MIWKSKNVDVHAAVTSSRPPSPAPTLNPKPFLRPNKTTLLEGLRGVLVLFLVCVLSPSGSSLIADRQLMSSAGVEC